MKDLKKLTKDDIKEIMSEARILRDFDHPNVVKCHGVAAIKEPIMIVMELVRISCSKVIKIVIL